MKPILDVPDDLAVAVEWLRKRFRHSSRTNVAEGRLTNRDAIVILLFVNGNSRRIHLQNALCTWRYGDDVMKMRTPRAQKWKWNPVTQKAEVVSGSMKGTNMCYFTAYFDGCDNHVGNDFNHRIREVETRNHKTRDSYRYKVRQCWYRTGTGVYALTLEGLKRAYELGCDRDRIVNVQEQLSKA